MILVSNPSIFAAAKGAINWDDVPDPAKRDIHSSIFWCGDQIDKKIYDLAMSSDV